jgi:type II secretory pathway pseudopilin PulG
MKNSKGVSLIALIITIIVIIILAAIVMNASTSTVGNAQYARFAQEFGEFSDQVALDAANIKSNTGIRGQIINDAQMFYMTANGFSSIDPSSGEDLNKDQGVAGYTMPVGYVLTNKDEDGNDYPYVLQYILNIGGAKDYGIKNTGIGTSSGEGEAAQVAYVIKDSAISSSASYTDESKKVTDGSAAREFYGDSNGVEYHFVTSNGQVFTLPGYPVQQSDGSIEYHIDSKNGHYYVVAGNSGKSYGEENVNGTTITNKKPILAQYLHNIHGINAITGASIDGTDGNTAAQQMATQSRRTYKNDGKA